MTVGRTHDMFHLRPRYLAGKVAQLAARPGEGWRSLKSGVKSFLRR